MASKRELELLLSARGLATAGARPSASAEYGRADALARLWREGPPAHAITELVPDEPAGRNAGLTSLGCRMAALACLGEDARIAWADPQDQWDPASAQAAGV
ncbi:MAG: hypothetical protein ACRD1L_10875, partial [Terriglobales bacterium]